MKILVICGPSGVGKSYLISILSQKGVYPLPVYTDRERRPSEVSFSDRTYVSKEEFDSLLNQFLYWFEFQGNRYGYRASDIEDQRQQNRHIAFNIPQTFLPELLKRLPEAIAISLRIKSNNFGLLTQRMIKRDIVDNDSEEERAEKLEKIKKRIQFALEESKLPTVSQSIEFEIEDDNTMHYKVLPQVFKLLDIV